MSTQIFIGVGQLVVFEAVTINGHGATIRQTCPGARVLLAESDLTLDGVTITGGTSVGNGAGSGGGGIRLDQSDSLAAQVGRTFTVRNSSIVGNCTASNGGGFKMNVDGDVNIVNSAIAGNQSNAVGGGFSHSHAGNVVMVNSTVTNNSSSDHAGVDARNGDFTAVYSDIVGNTALTPSGNCGVVSTGTGPEEDSDVGPAAAVATANVFQNVDSPHKFKAFGTVVGYPHNGLNCLVATVSSGYNLADDPSCQFTGPTDKAGTGAGFDPKLGALAANGGPTQTLLPQAGSPLINAIPVAACAGGDALAGVAVTTDQRGITRPQETGCEIGSVEIAATPIQVILAFTG